MTKTKIKYNEFINDIDLEQFYEAIGFEIIQSIKDWDMGYCLFPENHSHGDTTGKFGINRTDKYYNCFVCGGGSLLSLVIELYGWTVEESTEWLRQFAIYDTRTDLEFVNHLKSLLEYKGPTYQPLPYFNERVLNKFDGPIDYFRDRGISDQVIDECNLCYSYHVVKTAPIKQREGQPVKIDRDYTGPAAIFPHYWNNQLVGWQHRWINYPDPNNPKPTDQDWPKWLAKYTNTSDFPKHDTLYNYYWSLQQQQKVVLCESVPTVLFLRSLGISAVAYFGDVPNEDQLKLMRKFTQGVILAPDNDSNGDKLLQKATEYLEPYLDVYHIPKVGNAHGDLGDYAQYEDGAELVRQHLALAEISYISQNT